MHSDFLLKSPLLIRTYEYWVLRVLRNYDYSIYHHWISPDLIGLMNRKKCCELQGLPLPLNSLLVTIHNSYYFLKYNNFSLNNSGAAVYSTAPPPALTGKFIHGIITLCTPTTTNIYYEPRRCNEAPQQHYH